LNEAKEFMMELSDKDVLFGIDYYPEQWPPELWMSDAQRMAEMGIRAVRMMELAWAVIEPEEGKFDFSIFDKAIDLFAIYHIQTVLGTPTAAIPAWLWEKDPEILQIHPSGIQKQFGTRREACFNNPTYLAACILVVDEIGRHFGKNPNVIGWQIDNELGHEGTDKCICPNCLDRWHTWLKTKYKNIEEVNKIWGTVFWSGVFPDFDSIPMPQKQIQTTLNPGLKLDFDRFSSDSIISFVERQVAILKKYVRPDQWLTHNVFLTPHSAVVDMEKMFKSLTQPAGSCYPVWGDATEPTPYYFMSYFLSYVRGLKDTGNFSILEQFTSPQGHDSLGYLPPKDQVILWTNQSIARGANKIFYFRWRTAPYGQEQNCYGILNRDNKDTEIKKKIEENISKNQSQYSSFANVPFESQACLLYDKDNSRIIKDQFLSRGIFNAPNEYMQVGYDYELTRAFAPYVIFNINADVKSVQQVDLNKYKMISLPLYQMTDSDFVKRLTTWVEQGGALILGWRCGTRDDKNWATDKELPGEFAVLAGVKIHDFESLNLTKTKIRLKGLPLLFNGENWADVLEPDSARPIGWYTVGKKDYFGKPCITENKFGKGRVYYVGTSLDLLGIFFLYRKIYKANEMNPRFYGMGVEMTHRKDTQSGNIDVILNHNPKTRMVAGVIVPGFGMKIIPNKG
jgi:beta-galactosidase